MKAKVLYPYQGPLTWLAPIAIEQRRSMIIQAVGLLLATILTYVGAVKASLL